MFLLFVAWRVAAAAVAGRRDGARLAPARASMPGSARVWSPHGATTVIGITFFVMLMLVGAWAYTDVLAELARGMAAASAARSLLALALLLGAVLGGWTAGRFQQHAARAPRSCCAVSPAAC